MTELLTVDVLVVGDFALEPMNRDESRDIYQPFVERTARASTLLTSNRDRADWLALFDDPLLGQNAVDRFKNNAYDLIIDGESYRARLKPSVDKDGPPPSAPVTKPQPCSAASDVIGADVELLPELSGTRRHALHMASTQPVVGASPLDP